MAQLFREQRLLVAEAMLTARGGDGFSWFFMFVFLTMIEYLLMIQGDTGTEWPLCAVQRCPWFGLMFSSGILRSMKFGCVCLKGSNPSLDHHFPH